MSEVVRRRVLVGLGLSPAAIAVLPVASSELRLSTRLQGLRLRDGGGYIHTYEWNLSAKTVKRETREFQSSFRSSSVVRHDFSLTFCTERQPDREFEFEYSDGALFVRGRMVMTHKSVLESGWIQIDAEGFDLVVQRWDDAGAEEKTAPKVEEQPAPIASGGRRSILVRWA